MLFFALYSNFALATGEGAQSFTLDGQLFSDTTSTTPLLDANAALTLQILDASQTCILYEESQNVNTSATNGYFNIQVGAATAAGKRGANDSNNAMATVYSNSATNVSGKLVSNGGACTYSPVAGDERYLRMVVTPSSGPAQTLTPNMAIDSVSSAVVAENAISLQGLLPSQFLQVGTGDLTQSNLQSVFAAGNAAKLTSLLSVPPANYVTVSPANGTVQLPTVGGAPAAPVAGEIWYQGGSLKYYNGASVQTVGVSGSGLTALTGDVSASGSGSVVATVNSVGTSTAANVHTAEVLANAATNANTVSTIIKRDGSGNFIAGTANLTSAVVAQGSGVVFNDTTATPKTVTLTAPTTVTSNYVLKLPPAVAGTAGQVLTASDTSGTLAWTTPSTVATSYSGILPIANGGTNSSTALNNNRVMVSSGGSVVESAALTNGQILIGSNAAAPVAASLTAGTGITITPGAGSITIATSGAAPTGTAGGDLSGTYPNPTVAKLQGTSVSATAPSIAGQVLRYNGATWLPNFVAMTDLRSSVTGTNQFGTSCTASQTLTYNSVGDVMTCSNISVGASNFGSQTANTVLAAPNGSNGTPTFRALASADLPSIASGLSGILPVANGGTGASSLTGAGVFVNGGNSFGAGASMGTRDANSLTLLTNNSAAMTILSGGNVGIGTASPANTLHSTMNLSVGSTTSGIGGLRIQGVQSGSDGPAAELQFETNNYIGALISASRSGADNSTELDFWTINGGSLGNRMTILPNGNVGIGTTPGQALSVAGTIESTSGGFKFPDGTTQSTAASGGGSLSGDVTGTEAATVVAKVGTSTAANVHAAELLANAATNANTVSTIIKRDGSGNFIAGTANLTSAVVAQGSGVVFNDTTATPKTVTLTAPTTVTSNYVLKLPPAVAGTAGQVLTASDTSGTLAWTTPSTVATSYSGILPIANGGTNSSTALNNNRIMVSSGGSVVESAALTNGQILIGSNAAAPVAASLTAGTGITITPGAGSITIATSGAAPTGTAGGDLSGTYPNPGVAKLQGTAVNSTAPSSAGQVPRYDGSTAYYASFLNLSDLHSIVGPGYLQAFPNSSCTTGQTLTWSSITDTLTCSNIALSDSQITYASETQHTFFAAPTGGNGAPTFRAIASTDLPSGIYDTTYFKNGGNSFGSGAVIGTADNNSLTFKTNATTAMTLDTSGRLGIGISPTSALTLKAGTTTVAPLQLTSGVNLTTPLSGAIEYDGTNLYYTNSTPARLTLATVGGAQTFSGADTFSGDVSMTGAGTGLAVTNNETVGGTMQVTGATSLNGGATVAANQNLSMTSGTGQFTQTYSGTGPAHAITDTAAGSGDILDLTTTSTAAASLDKALNISVSGANATNTVTRYGAYSNVTSTGTASTNIAGYFSASGATNNYGLIVANGGVGIGTTTPHSKVEINGNGLTVSDASASGVAGALSLSNYGYYGLSIIDNNTNSDMGAINIFSNSPFLGLTGYNGNAASPTATLGGDSLGGISFQGLRGTTWGSGAAGAGIYVTANGNWAPGSYKADMDLTATNDILFAPGGGPTSLIIKASGNVGIGKTSPTAALNIKAGTATLAPLQLTSGVNLTTPLSGAIEYDGTNLYYTDSTATRRTIASSGGTSAQSFNTDVSMTGAGTGLAVTNNETVGGTMQVTGVTSLNGGATVAANQNLSMTSGTGQFTQTYSGTGPAHAITDTAAGSGDILDLTTTSTAAASLDKALNISVSGANASNSVTRYGAYSSVTATGTSSTNIAGYFAASGATNNYGLIVNGGNVGIGTTSPGQALSVAGTIESTSGGFKFPDGTTQTTASSGGGASTWVIKTANYTAASGDQIMADTSGGAFTITLPASPTIGMTVTVMDVSGSFATNNMTIGYNSNNLMGLAQNMTINNNNVVVSFVYSNATYGWRIK